MSALALSLKLSAIKTLSAVQRAINILRSAGPGAWYDPSDLTTLFQDSAGTTPVTAVEQPVGLMLDKSNGLVLGGELVTNGTFDTDTTGWLAVGATLSVVGGQMQVETTGAGVGLGYQELTLVVGKIYKLTLVANIISGTGLIAIGHAPGSTHNYLGPAFTGSGEKQVVFTATATTTYIAFFQYTPTAGLQARFDNISVRELPGNHAIQPTATSRPTLSARKNWLLGTEVLSTQNVTTKAASHVLSFYGTGTVTLSGTSTAGPLVGTGVSDRVSLTFTPTAGTLTLTVSGSVTRAQLEYAI